MKPLLHDYFEYERQVAKLRTAPFLKAHEMDLAGTSVLDVGSGYGGTLAGLDEVFPGLRGTGIERDGEMVASGRLRLRGRENLQLLEGDFFAVDAAGFDLIVMRDVLEHIGDYAQALLKAASLLNPGGMLYVTFAPFGGPFGGHQQNGSGWAARLPWIHHLPESWFLSVLGLEGNSYKSKSSLQADMQSVLKTRLTLTQFHRVLSASKLKVRFEQAYLSRPEYGLKFGWPTVKLPRWPGADAFLATGVECLLSLEG